MLYISLAIAAVMIAILFICAPFIGTYYQNDALVLPLRVYAFSLLFDALSSVQKAKLSREMAFKQLLLCSLIGYVVSGIIGIVMAYLGAGIWALIAYYFSSTIINCISMVFAAKWWPQLCFSVSRAKELFSYGWKMLVSSILCSLYADIRVLIIGKKFSESDLGYYNRGQQIPDILSHSLDLSIQAVMFPALSKEQDKKDVVKKLLRKSVTFSALLVIPVMLGLVAIAEPLVRFLLTEKWLPCVLFMQIICIGNAALPFTSSKLVAIKAVGRSDVYMRLEVVRRIAMVAVLLITVFAFHSATAIAWGYAISTWIDAFIISIPTYRLLGYRPTEQLMDLWRALLSSILMAGVVLAVGLLPLPTVPMLLLQIFVGIITYLLLNILLRNPALKEGLSMVKKLGKKAN